MTEERFPGDEPPLDERHQIGANNPPEEEPKLSEFDQALKTYARWLEGADKWAQRNELTEEQAALANDFITGAKLFKAKLDDMRAAEKKPHDDAGKAVQAKYLPMIEAMDKVWKGVKPKLDAFLQKKQREADAAKAEAAKKAREAAEALAREQEAAKLATSESERIEAERKANELAKEVKQQTRASNAGPAKVDSATGLGNRVSYREPQRVAKVVDVRRAVLHYIDTPEIADLVQRLASAELRRAGKDAAITIPGVEITTEQPAGAAA